MRKHQLLILPIIFLGLTACCDEPTGLWSPTLDEVDYGYLQEKTDQALEHLQQAANAATSGQESARAIDDSRQRLLAIRDYYLPLTEVRQRMIEADRYLYNGQSAEAKKRLQGLRNRLLATAEMNQAGIRTALMEVVTQCDDLLRRLDLDQKPGKADVDALIHKVNLMLTRGDLVIAGQRFTP